MDETPVKHTSGRQPDPPAHKISTLKRREIQSPLFASLMRGFIQAFGHEQAVEVASRAVEQDATLNGKMMAEKFGGNSMKAMLSILKEVWAEEGALEYTILEQTDLRFSFDVTRCHYAELYERLGIKEFGCLLSCSRDGPFIKSFNPRMKLFRTQTIMEGGALCDFRIVMDQ